MPIIINEIEINVEVVPNGNSANTAASADFGSMQEAIIKECVEKVMEIINQKNER